MTQNTNNLAAYIWSLTDLLRCDFRQSQYGRVVLPFTLLRRLECVLEDSKDNVLNEFEKVKKVNLPEEAQEKMLLRATDGLLSQIISRLIELLITDHLTEKDLVNYAYTIRDKISENTLVMKQIANNSAEQAMLGDFPKAVDDAVMDSSEARQNQMMQLLSSFDKAAGFAKVVFDLLKLAKK